ncbi:hypothetical protein [Anaerosolibacter sp.]|uniref:ParM/StbA family protein n=1 Tax=Anaerosolibacter sp. TaxID=1872527 RepID=UPI0039EF2187
MAMCVAIDNGYFDTKVKNQETIRKFKSKIEKATGNIMEKNVLEYFGERYLIGHGKDDISNDKTRGLTHKLCTLKALADITDTVEEFNIALDLPLIHYKNKAFRDDFERYMTDPAVNVVTQNGKQKKIIIRNCIIAPQGIAALYAYDARQYKNKVIGVLDIGGLTIDGCIVENLTPIKESAFTINAGTIIFENKVKTAFNEEFFLNVQDYEVPYLIENGVPGREIESRILIEKLYDEHFEEVIREMRAKNWSIETVPILGIGGGTLRFEGVFNRYLPTLKPSESPVYDNVLGLYNIGRMI